MCYCRDFECVGVGLLVKVFYYLLFLLEKEFEILY